VAGPCDPRTLHPDLDWLQRELAGPQPPRMVVLVNPCNPTGARWQGCEGCDLPARLRDDACSHAPAALLGAAEPCCLLPVPAVAAGVLLSAEEVQRAADLCAAAGAWLVLDNTYEQVGARQGPGRARPFHLLCPPNNVQTRQLA